MEYRTIELCRHDWARMRSIGHETVCAWLENKGYPVLRRTDAFVTYDFDIARHEGLFFVIVTNNAEASDYEFYKAQAVRLWSIWVDDNDVSENLDKALAELEALQAAL